MFAGLHVQAPRDVGGQGDFGESGALSHSPWCLQPELMLQWDDNGSPLKAAGPFHPAYRVLCFVLLLAILRLIKRAEAEAETVGVRNARACLNTTGGGAERPTPANGTT